MLSIFFNLEKMEDGTMLNLEKVRSAWIISPILRVTNCLVSYGLHICGRSADKNIHNLNF